MKVVNLDVAWGLSSTATTATIATTDKAYG